MPSPAGEVVVCDGGLAVSLRSFPETPAWVCWDDIRDLDASVPHGIRVYLSGGLSVHVSALAGRDIYERQRAHIQSARLVTA